MSAVLLYPVHADCIAAEKELQKRNLDAVAYRGRLTEGDEANCWNPQADVAEGWGLCVTGSICPSCPESGKCRSEGYLYNLEQARNARIVIATHARAAFGSVRELQSGRNYLSIHEEARAVIRPTHSISESDLHKVRSIIGRLLSDPVWLDWFGDACRQDDDGNWYVDDQLRERKDRLYEFIRHMAVIIDTMIKAMSEATKTTEWNPGPGHETCSGIGRLLYRATRESKETFDGPPWRLVLGAARGDIDSAGIIVEKVYVKGSSEPTTTKRLLGVWDNIPDPTGCTIWFSDATADLDPLQQMVKHRVHDGTPRGRLPLHHKSVQIPRDITRATSKRIVQNVLRGILGKHPDCRRVGVIAHSSHQTAVRKLGAPFDERIAKVSYFGSGLDRSCNDWHRECDLLVILGTPRIREGIVREYLFQIGQVGAACRDVEWKRFMWLGATESGEQVRVEGAGYRDDADWRRAHRNLVRSKLVQAIGRARGTLTEGIDVVVVSSEECGLPLSESHSDTINGTATAILDLMKRQLTEQNPTYIYVENASVSTAEISKSLKLSARRVRQVLVHLESQRLVRRLGERSGWALVVPP